MSVVDVHVSNLRKLGYDSLEDWLSKSKNHIYIGRNILWVEGAEKSIFHNPYSVKKYGLEESLRLYKKYIINDKKLMNKLKFLKGKKLGCWCINSCNINNEEIVCHGQILLMLIKKCFDKQN